MSELLRNAMDAYIDPRKLRDYALNINHDSGRFKAAFFAQMGYDAENWQLLERDIREQHLTTGAERGQGFSVVGKKKKESPQSGKMGLSKTQLPKEVTREAYHTGGDEYRGGCV